jgi:multisubunit Na+/H+ antiporter MnhG subunit
MTIINYSILITILTNLNASLTITRLPFIYNKIVIPIKDISMRRILAFFGVALVVVSLSGCIFPGPYGHGGGHGGGHPHYYWR